MNRDLSWHYLKTIGFYMHSKWFQSFCTADSKTVIWPSYFPNKGFKNAYHTKNTSCYGNMLS